jgi:murein DD-endopeptidase MepM/ murein hydrolase activator NlpD
VLLLAGFIFVECLSEPPVITEPVTDSEIFPSAPLVIEKSFDIWRDNTEDFFAVAGEMPRPGDPVTLIFLPRSVGSPPDEPDTGRYAGLRALLLNKNGKKLAGASFFDWQLDGEGHRVKACVFSVPSLYDGEALVRIESDGNNAALAEFTLRLGKRTFVAEEIPLNPSNTALRTVPDPQKTAESELLWSIISRRGDDVYTTGPFTPPVAADTRRTSFFGDRRVYRYSNGKSDTAVHAGIDYGIPTGTPVKACAAGKVVLARARIVTGNSVIIEHLPGVYSIYYHLDKIIAEEGVVIQSGDVIGLSGATGLATGPHLHWELRAATENTDPDALCARPLLDAEAAQKLIEEWGDRVYAKLSR